MAFIPYYILILFVTIVIDYYAGRKIEESIGARRKAYLIASIISTVAVLVIFKYFNFFNANLTVIARFLDWNYPIGLINIILPIGLSFHTFQSLAYVIEVYRNKQKVERNFGIYSLYVMFYPQLVAGPIERPQNLIHQFYEEHKFEYQRVVDGLKLMAWGMFKKVVIADRLASLVNIVYGDVHSYPGMLLLEATIFFTFQIYCDFSGYTDIARGSAKVMGFKLMKNFNRPYFSKSISEFWKRWHISLSSWFKDYLYIPLGGNRVLTVRWYFNIFIVFLISGLWHGANWTFVVWGGLHGFYLIFGIISQRLRDRMRNMFGLKSYPILNKLIKVGITFSLVSFSWIFFRASNLSDAIFVVKSIFMSIPELITRLLKLNWHAGFTWDIGLGQQGVFIVIFFLLILGAAEFIQRNISIWQALYSKPIYVRWILYYVLIISIIIFGYYGPGPKQFIYFQF